MIAKFAIPTRLSGFYLFYYGIVGAFMPYWSLYLQHEGFNYQQIGVLTSIGIVTRFFAPFIWGWIADKTGKRMGLVRIATWVEAFIWLMIFVISRDFKSIALLMFIFSFFQNAILAQFEGVTLFWLGEQKSQLYSKVRKWGSIGFILGVFAVGWILDFISIEYLPIILLIIAMLTFLWSFTIKEPDNAPKAQKKLDSIRTVLLKPIVLCFFIIEFFMLFAQAPFYSFYSNFLKLHGFDTVQIGMLWSVGVISEIIMFAYAQWFFKHFNFKVLVSLCILMTGLRFILVGTFPNNLYIQFLTQTFHAFSFGLFHLLAMKIIFENFSSTQQGRAQAMYSTMWGLGVAAGSLLAGTYWVDLGGEWIFKLAGLSVIIALFFVKFLPLKLQFQQ